MSKIYLHKLRHSAKVDKFVADTKSDSEWVYLSLNGEPMIRQSKTSGGNVFAQGTNPDYKGRPCFILQYRKGSEWRTWDRQASIGDIKNQLPRLIESIG